MDKVSQALDAIEAVGADGTGDILSIYRKVRPHLEQLVNALTTEGGDHARVGAVIENLMAGADSLASGAQPVHAKAAEPANSI